MLKNATPPMENAYFELQDGAKMGPSWAKTGHVGPMLGASWHLEAILPPSCRHDAILSRLGAILEATWRQLGRTWQE